MSNESNHGAIDQETRDKLIAVAREASRAAYAPYSHFRVGAALLCSDGTVMPGANVENRSYGLAICAERSAIGAAVTAGHQDFVAIAVYSPDADYPVSPCGACRQVISEFMESDGVVIFADRAGGVETHTMDEILPFDALHELRERPVD